MHVKKMSFCIAFLNETIYVKVHIKNCFPTYNYIGLHSSAFILSELHVFICKHINKPNSYSKPKLLRGKHFLKNS